MKKRFNYTGVCVPEKHYMVDITGKIRQIFKIIEKGDYFVINRPRQYGKTTVVHMLNRFLKTRPDYFPINISFEGIDAPTYAHQDRFIKTFLDFLKDKFLFLEQKHLEDLIDSHRTATGSMAELSRLITSLVKAIGKNTVLMIDEVDKSCNNQSFLDFLGMLRDKFLKQSVGEDYTFHSVILTGVHDVKSLKIKISSHDEAKYNSPWNIAVDFDVDLSFQPDEIATMLEAYKKEQSVNIDVPFFAERIFYYTSGYPFLVSYICYIISENILPEKGKQKWVPGDLERAVQLSFTKESTNFDSLVKNLENNPELYELVFNIIMNGVTYSYNRRNSVIHLGTLYGVLKEDERKTRINNRLYEQLIYDYMSSKMETGGDIAFKGSSSGYIAKDGSLDIEKVIRKFQEFMKEQY
ncbi:MAG: AAA family ATPase, partial [bacterium]|nr:AAA family ATPase [bacterium]